MAKTKKNIAKPKKKKTVQAEAAAPQELTQAEIKAQEKAKKEEAKAIAEKKKQKEKEKNPGFFTRVGNDLKGTWTELKKTQWLDGEQLNKATGSVFGIVTAFTLLTWVVDSGLGALTALILGL